MPVRSSAHERPAHPLLSIVLTGRNDGYGGDFTERCLRTLRFNHQQLTSRGIPYEIVFVEWAPPADLPLLADLVFEAMPDLDRGVCAWYVVDARYQSALSLNPRLKYQEFIAKNVGIRRARGRFVLTTNCDVYLGRTVLETLARVPLETRTIYRAARHDLRMGIDCSALSWDALEDVRNLDGRVKALKPPLMNGGTGDFILLDRQTFLDLEGFNEVYRVARFGIDANFLVKAFSLGVAIRDIGGPVYHINHVGSYRLTRRAFQGREQEAHWGDSRWPTRAVVYANPPTWGLAAAPVSQRAANCWRLDFSWDAVPPLVDLSRVVGVREAVPSRESGA